MLNPITGAALRDAGQQLALEFAGFDWTEIALDHLRLWLRIAPDEFTFEQFRAQSMLAGMPSPRSHHAWGALTTVAAKKGLIEFTGRYEAAKSIKTHAHVVKVWRRGCGR